MMATSLPLNLPLHFGSSSFYAFLLLIGGGVDFYWSAFDAFAIYFLVAFVGVLGLFGSMGKDQTCLMQFICAYSLFLVPFIVCVINLNGYSVLSYSLIHPLYSILHQFIYLLYSLSQILLLGVWVFWGCIHGPHSLWVLSKFYNLSIFCTNDLQTLQRKVRPYLFCKQKHWTRNFCLSVRI